MRKRPRVRWGALARRVVAAVAATTVLALTIGLPNPAEAKGKARHRGGPARPYVESSATDPSKDAALILEADTGKILYSRNAYVSRHPASLTKMMTLYLLFDAMKKGTVNLATPLAISQHAAEQKPTNLHLWAGDSITVENAIRAIVIRSANDVAVAIAEGIGGTESHFAQMMTQQARELGMNNTYYHNASGLPDVLQVTTASDLSILARHLRTDFPQYYPYFSLPGFSYRGTNYTTHDNLVGRYDGTDGIKTGYTGMSGFNLVSSVQRGGRRIIGVVMGGRTARKRDKEMMALLDDAFGVQSYNPAATTLVANNTIQPAVPPAVAPTPSFQTAGLTPPTTIKLTPPVALKLKPPKLTMTPTPRPAAPRNTVNLRSTAQDGDDEDAAENRRAPDDDILSPVVPKPKPIVVAAYKPQKPKTAPHVDLGEGDIGDMPKIINATGKSRAWAIQIGAYADATAARTQLASYAERSMDLLGQVSRIVVPFQGSDGHKLFRARFGPFAEKEARAVCATLTKRGQTCFAAATAD